MDKKYRKATDVMREVLVPGGTLPVVMFNSRLMVDLDIVQDAIEALETFSLIHSCGMASDSEMALAKFAMRVLATEAKSRFGGDIFSVEEENE